MKIQLNAVAVLWLFAIHAHTLSGFAEDGNVHGVTAESLKQLAIDLDEPNYSKTVAATSKLIDIINSRGPKAEQAHAILDNFSGRALDWLVSVGNSREELENLKGPARILSVWAMEKVPADNFKYLLNRNLYILRLRGKPITDDHLLVLTRMPNLELLDVYDTAITGASLGRMTLPSLKILHLADCPLSDKHLCEATFPNLQVLDLSGSSVTNETLANLRLTSVSDLNLQRTKVDANGMEHIARFRKLENLRVDLEVISPRVLEIISTEISLKSIRIRCDEAQRPKASALIEKLPPKCKATITVSAPHK